MNMLKDSLQNMIAEMSECGEHKMLNMKLIGNYWVDQLLDSTIKESKESFRVVTGVQ